MAIRTPLAERQPMQMRAGPTGLHLFHRTTGTNILFDEAKLPPSLWSAAPRNVSVALTNACDLRCAYCYAPKTPAHLDKALLVPWIDEMSSHGCLGVGFGGGEPTLCEDLPWLCNYIQRNTQMVATFTTHGHHLDDSLATALSGNVHFVRISMDGVGSTYESLRGRPFPRLLRVLETAADLAPFGINFLVNALTLPCLDDAARIAMNSGASELLLLPERPTPGRPGIDRRTSQALVTWISSYVGDVPLTISATHREGLPTCNPPEDDAGLRAYAHIDACGRLKRSSYDQYGVPVGSAGILNAMEILADATTKEQ